MAPFLILTFSLFPLASLPSLLALLINSLPSVLFNQEYPKGVNARGLSGPAIISKKALSSRLVLGRALDPHASGTG